MKITSIESFVQDTRIGLVRVSTEDGATGWGQMAPIAADISALALHRLVAPVALGMDASDPDAVSEDVMLATYKFPGTFVARALSGLDTALWDLSGKRQGKSVCELLGGRPRPFPVYGSSMSRDVTPDDEAVRFSRLRDEHGYHGFKIKIGKRLGFDEDEWPGRSEEMITVLRRRLGDDVLLLADGNSGFRPQRAIEIGRLMQENAFTHFEEPCPYWELEWTAQVADALDIPVAGGEQDYDMKQWERMIAMRTVDICQPDVCYVGGLSRALRVASLAQEAGLPCIPHSSNHSLVMVFTLHMMGAIPNAGPHAEFSIEPQTTTAGFYSPILRAEEGAVQIPEGSGWGVEIDPVWLGKAVRMVSEV